MVTNEDVQEKFEEFLDGGRVEWQLLKLYFHQHGGFSRKNKNKDGDVDSAVGFAVSGRDIIVSIIDLDAEGDTFYAEEESVRRVRVDNQVEHKLPSMIDRAANAVPLQSGSDDDDGEDVAEDLDYMG